MMESTTQQDNNDDIIEDDDDKSVGIYEDDSDDEYDVDEDSFILDSDTFERLKQNDPSMIDLRVYLNCDDHTEYVTYFFNKIDWKEDGSFISNNTHLKRLRIYYNGRCLGRPYDQPYILGEEGDDLPTRQLLQDFFSCIYRSSSIKTLSIQSSIKIVGEFAECVIEGLSGHPSLTRVKLVHSELGSIACEALGKVLKHPKSKLKDFHLQYCRLNDEGIQKMCHELLLGNGTSPLKRLNLMINKEITTAGWQALSNVIQHPNCKLTTLGLIGNNCILDTDAKLLGMLNS